jgi:predicted PurR-regulated permease PerM
MKQQTLRTIVVLALAATAFYLLHRLITAVLWAGLIAISTWPLHQRLAQRLGPRSRRLSAALLTGVIVSLLLVPFAYVLDRAWHELPVLLRLWTSSQEGGLPAPPWLSGLPLAGSWLAQKWDDLLGAPGDLSGFVRSFAGAFDLAKGRTLVALVGRDAMKFFFCIVVLFFLYLDGDALSSQIDAIVSRQLGPEGKTTLPLVVRSIRGAVNGLVLVSFGVAVLMTLACIATEVPHPAAIGFATGVLGMVPFGAGVVLVLVVVYLLGAGSTIAAVTLLVLGAIGIFIADHFVRPKLMAGGSRLPLALALLGIVGGLETFGVLGLFLGPTLLAILVAIWRELAAPQLDPTTTMPP